MDDETNKTGPAFENLEQAKQKLDALILVRNWMKALEWPSYIGIITFSSAGRFALVYPTDMSVGFPAHFQKDILKALPIIDGKLRRVLTEDDGTTAWHGDIEMHGVDEKFELKKVIDLLPGFSVILECGRKTDCKLIQKEVTKTVWEMDCSSKARAEVAGKVDSNPVA